MSSCLVSLVLKRENKYHWLAHVITKRWIFFSRFDSSHEASTLSHIVSSRTVGVIHGDIRERWLQKQNTSNLISILDYNNAVEMLMRDRFDFLFYESFGVFSTLKKLGYSSDMVKSELVARESDVYIVMSKSIDDSALVLEIQNQFSILKKSDWYSNHLKKWVKKLNAEGVADAWIAHGVLKY